MNTPRPILLAVRAALSTAIVATPAMVATGVGVSQGQPAELIARCQRGQEVAVCAGQAVADQPDLHRHEVAPPPEPDVSVPLTGQAIHSAAGNLTPSQPRFPDPGAPLGTPLPLLVG
jgi:hypothetical protein